MCPARLAASALSDRWRLDGRERPNCRDCAIREFVFCGGVPANELAALEAEHEVLQIGEGHTLYVEGEAAQRAYLVKGGAVRLCKLLPDGRRQITEFALPGDWLGLAKDGCFVHTMQAIVPTTLCEFTLDHIESLCSQFSEVEVLLRRQWQDSLVATQEQILMLGRMNPVEKLSSFLVKQYERRERLNVHGNPVYLPMSRTDIADYLGVTIETVSRSMSRLRGLGMIEPLDRSRVQIVDLDGLRRQAGL